MQPTWITKTDPVHHPVRYMAKVWRSRMAERFGVSVPEFSAKEYGQLKTLMNYLGELAPSVIDWSLDTVNWWHFCQRVRVSHKIRFLPDRPAIGFLLQYRGHALALMYADGQSSGKLAQENLSKIAAAKKLDELEVLCSVMAH